MEDAGDPQLTARELTAVAADVEAVDIQRLLVWYFDAVDPGRSHISSAPRRERR